MNAKAEEWRSIKGYEGLYDVSSRGRIVSLTRVSAHANRWGGTNVQHRIRKELAPSRTRYGLRVQLCRGGVKTQHYVARLMMQAFVPDLPDGALEYVDGNYLNCTVENVRSRLTQVPEGQCWIPVKGLESAYRVSSEGMVASLPRQTKRGKAVGGRLLKPYSSARLGKVRYPIVNLSTDGRTMPRAVHILVCEAFHGPRPAGRESCHRDGNVLNNRADNLYWGTKAENERDKVVAGFARLTGVSVSAAWDIAERLCPKIKRP